MKMDFKKVFKDLQKQAKKHSPAIMTGMGAVGVVTTAVLASVATYRATRKVDEAELHKKEPLTKKEVVKEVWKEYIPAVVTGTVSMACIIGAHSQNAKRNAALATAYQATQVAFSDYKDEVLAQIGDKKAKQIQSSVTEKKMQKSEVPSDSKVIVMTGDIQLFYDDYSGRYFRSNVNDIQKAMNKVNQRMLSDNYASVNDYWDELESPDMPPLDIGLQNGWNIDDGMIDVTFSTHMTADGRSAIVVYFSKDPHINYDMFG